MTDEDEPTDTTDEETYTCEACGESFESEAALERHINDVGIVD